MQLTKLDRWLKERFIYETHILTLRLPEGDLPAGIEVQDVEQSKGGDYRHRMIIKNNLLAENMVKHLKDDHIMHAVHVVEGGNWYNKRIAPEGKSFTYMWIFRFITMIMLCVGAYGFFKLSQNEELRATIMGAIEDLKSGM
ncbi:MAG: hypothetical protein P8P36_11145 [Akkermansiaceae bacterium]|nr:hypothetical protein [Akkermansiaceae bacterium]